jgi:hypothetical protein
MPPEAPAGLDASLAMEGHQVVGLGSEATRRQRQLNDVRIIPLVHAGSDLALAPGH